LVGAFTPTKERVMTYYAFFQYTELVVVYAEKWYLDDVESKAIVSNFLSVIDDHSEKLLGWVLSETFALEEHKAKQEAFEKFFDAFCNLSELNQVPECLISWIRKYESVYTQVQYNIPDERFLFIVDGVYRSPDFPK
jgi:hypothetical protein